MVGTEWRSQLRGAVYRGDGEAVLALLRTARMPDELQLVGDGLLAAIAQHVQDASDHAIECAKALRERDWYGDTDLADQLEGELGTGATPMLRPLPVDLDELAGILEGDPTYGSGRVDLHTGDVWPQAAIEYAQEIGDEDENESEDTERWLWVECEGSHEGYRDMEFFIGLLSDPGRADRLAIAIEGRGSFRRFKDVLARWPEEMERWQAFSNDRQRGRARAWLARAGYRVTATREPMPEP